MITPLATGFLSPFRALGFLRRHKGLWRFVVIPFIINVAVFASSAWLGLHWFDRVVSHYLPSGEAWYWTILAGFLWCLALVVILLVVFFTFTVVGNLIASPFNDYLSEKVEKILAGTAGEEAPFSLSRMVREAGRSLVEEAKRLVFFIGGMAVLLLLHLLPGVGLVLYPPLSLAFTVFFLAVDYTSYVYGRKGLTFADQRRFLLANKMLMAGFGLGVLCLLAIPFLQFFCIPLAVVAATRLWYEHRERG